MNPSTKQIMFSPKAGSMQGKISSTRLKMGARRPSASLSLGVFLLWSLVASEVLAFGVACRYSENNPVTLYPSESEVFSMLLYVKEGGTVTATMIAGSDIAGIVNPAPEYFIPPETAVPIDIRTEVSATEQVGEIFEIGIRFLLVGGGLSIAKYVAVEVVPIPCSEGESTTAGAYFQVTPEDCTGGVVGGSPATITFDQVDSGGCTTLCTSALNVSPPSGYELKGPSVEYNISTTALYTGDIEVCINYGDGLSDEENLGLFHKDGAEPWFDVTTSVDMVNNMICGDINSFSTFAVFGPSSSPPVIAGSSAVGGTAEMANKIDLLMPWIALALLIGTTLVGGIWKRRRVRAS